MIKDVLISIMRKAPFFVSKLVLCEHKFVEGIKTAQTDGRDIEYNQQFFQSLPFKQRETLICHELGHIIFAHHLRFSNRNAGLWNVACDHAINLLLKAWGFEPIVGWLCDDKYIGWSAEAIYSDLSKQSESEKEKQKNQSQASGGSFTPPTGMTKEETEQALDDAAKDIQKAIATVQRTIAGIEKSESLSDREKTDKKKSLGNGLGELIQGLNDIAQSRIPWGSVIEQFLYSMGANDYSYIEPDIELMEETGFYFPSIQSVEFGDILLVLDVSASLSHISKQVASECLHALKQIDKPELDVAYVSTHLHKIKTITCESDIELIEGGGTVFTSFFNNDMPALEDKYKGIIFLTDGHVQTSQWRTPNLKVLWVLTEPNGYFERVLPFGDIVRFIE